MSKRISSTICAVVERPDRHCGDDLVLIYDYGIFVHQPLGLSIFSDLDDSSFCELNDVFYDFE